MLLFEGVRPSLPPLAPHPGPLPRRGEGDFPFPFPSTLGFLVSRIGSGCGFGLERLLFCEGRFASFTVLGPFTNGPYENPDLFSFMEVSYEIRRPLLFVEFMVVF